ncbi:hypothetical protein AB0A63_34635 [Lentzea sp. NPDC042327]|uniref:hypothetical protein n=1 Tax=Lentzea sp. NPDC042327 TaxID=3154801 RepID=UPI0033C0DF0D
MTAHDEEFIARVLPDGCLELFCQSEQTWHKCSRRGTAMWIALRRSDWRPDLAAHEIAWQLNVDADSVRCDAEAWLAHFRMKTN